MSLFATTFESPELLQGYLTRLGLLKESPSLVFLNQLIRQHQHVIPFENLSRIIDFKEKKDQFSTLSESLEAICNGQGSVCWSHARSFKWLLTQLGFDTHYLYMDPGHVCLKVTLDQDYYVEVGYAAPFFEAKPLNQSFFVKTPLEDFHFQHRDHFVDVIRNPGPSKRLSLTIKDPHEIEAEFLKGNQWRMNRFLCGILVHKFIDESVVRLLGTSFMDFRSGKSVEKELSQKELEQTLQDVFHLDPELFHRAHHYLEREN
jgi:arylamine N-acetyltransferase